MWQNERFIDYMIRYGFDYFGIYIQNVYLIAKLILLI